MLLLDFYFRSVKHRESLKDHCIYPWYVIVHHEALTAWWQWLWRTITISSGRLTPTWFKRLSYSDNLSTRSTIELFSFTSWTKNLVGGLIPLNKGTSMKSQFHLFRTSLMFRDVSKRLRRLASKPFKYFALNYRVVIRNVYVGCSQHPQTTLEVQHTEWCIKDISLLRSNEDNPRFYRLSLQSLLLSIFN